MTCFRCGLLQSPVTHFACVSQAIHMHRRCGCKQSPQLVRSVQDSDESPRSCNIVVFCCKAASAWPRENKVTCAASPLMSRAKRRCNCIVEKLCRCTSCGCKALSTGTPQTTTLHLL